MRILHTSQLAAGSLIQLIIANLLAIIGFFLLYLPFSPRPYSNLIYFFILLVGGIFLARDTGYSLFKETKKTAFATLVGVALMLSIYGLMRCTFHLVKKNPTLAGLIDTSQWRFFVRPWVEINLFLSVAGVLMIVIALEFFYRAYLQEFFAGHLSPNKAILAASVLSGLRGFGGGGILAGPIDFFLCLIWGWVYHHGGLLAAIIVHMTWDICFVYFAP